MELNVPLVSSKCDFHTPLSRRTLWLHRIPFAVRVMDYLSRRLFRRAVRQGQYDVILFTSPEFDSRFLDERADAPFLMVVHDLMTCVTAPDGLFDAAGPGMTSLLYAACRASLVLCISNDTRDALLKQVVVDPRRVVVVPTGNLLASARATPTTSKLPEKFLLFVGERSGRKGFYSLVRALQPILQEYPDLQLVCTGRLSHTEEDYLSRWGLGGGVTAVVADDSTLVALYQRAFALVYPSLYEGFGLPVLEAMHFNCPVITTQEGALREIAGSAALFVDPFAVDSSAPSSIESAVRKLLEEPETRQEYIARGAAQAALFRVPQMMDAFRDALVRAAKDD